MRAVRLVAASTQNNDEDQRSASGEDRQKKKAAVSKSASLKPAARGSVTGLGQYLREQPASPHSMVVRVKLLILM